jgi:cation:H+ antiporter
VTLLLDLAIFAFGVALLVVGAWLLVTGGSRLAALLGVAPVVIGLTVVAFGTSAPELFVSLVAALRGSGGLMLGNVVGSNVANLGLILGATAMIAPVSVERGLMKREIPLLLGVSAGFALLCFDGTLERWEGLLLTALFGLFMVVTLRGARAGRLDLAPAPAPSAAVAPHRTVSDAPRGRAGRIALYGGLILLGIGGLSGGGHLIVTAATDLALRMGVSEALIGLSLVAVGTSLPELATSLIAAARRESDIALGNIVGSNLFNLLAVAGPVAALRPVTAAGGVSGEQVLAMLVITFMLPLCVRGRHEIGRVAGSVLLATYVAIMVWWARGVL